MDILEIVIIVTGLAGQLLVARKNKWGFALWIVGNFALSAVFLQTCKYGLIGLHLVYTTMQAWGFLRWHREGQDA